MAVGTGFSVTRAIRKPISNPSSPIADANKVGAVSSSQLYSPSFIGPVGVWQPEGADIVLPVEPFEIGFPALTGALPQADISTPNVVTPLAESVSNLPQQVSPIAQPPQQQAAIITPKSGTPVEPDFPLNHARIMYNNTLLINQGLSANNGSSTAINVLKRNTYEKWRFSNGGEIIITLTEARLMDCVCIGAHNIGSLSAVIGIEHSANLTGDDFAAFAQGRSPEDDAPIMFYRVSRVNVRRLKIIISGNGNFEVGYISAGRALQMQRPFFNGHTPITDSDITKYYVKRSESGNIIGQDIKYIGYKTNYSWDNISDEWYREYIPPFKASVKRNPIFIAWNLLEYPLDVGFGVVEKDISASMQNGTMIKRTGLSFDLLGY